MIKEQMNKIKAVFAKKGTEDNKSDKKKIENLAVFLVVLIITLIAVNSILKGSSKKQSDSNSLYKELATKSTSSEVDEDVLEKRLENILSTMSGVRKSKSSYYIF